ncbi:MAG TPA: hypothetical protein V6C99_02220 [Oculatellaceae cyanobacterium]
MDGKLKFKHLNPDNWLEQENVIKHIVHVYPDGQQEPVTQADWLKKFLAPRLPECVPIEIIELYEVARGCMLYGYFFYPLYTVGHNQLFLVLDAATAVKCEALGMEKADKKKFVERINYLLRLGLIDEEEKHRWEAVRSLRNSIVHRTSQMLLSPNFALDGLYFVRDDLTKLFAE